MLADATPARDDGDDDAKAAAKEAKEAAKLAKAEADKIAKAEKLAKAEADKIARAEKLAAKTHEPAALTSTVQGIVTAGRITITELEDNMPAVDIIAGTDTALVPEVDVIAGDPGENAPWPLAESQPHEAAPTS